MASISINIPDGEVSRVLAAFTEVLKPVDGNGDPISATAADVKDWIRRMVIREVQAVEYRQAQEQVSAPSAINAT
jgi:hypothetical protein